jgi:hypothetical protein
MAQKGWLTLDPIEISAQYADKSIKVRNFANVFGADGELINRAFADIKKTLGGKAPDDIAFRNKYEDQLRSSLNAFWGVHGKNDKRVGKLGSVMAATFTTLANVTYLPRVVVSSLGDLIQPIQNSGVLSALKSSKSIVPGVKSFATRSGFQYDKAWERELQAVQTKGADPLSTIDKNLSILNTGFFKLVGLSTLTKVARTFAYDAGVYRTFDIAKKIKKSKGRISKSLQTEMNGLGIDKDQLSVISKFKNAEEAFSDTDANVFLDMAGRRSADRDAIVPIVGNRLLFSQSKNPYVKATGQFLSWAQAKSAQSNYLIERLEDGDAKQAVRMLAGAVVYAGVGELKEWAKPNYDEYNPDNLEAVSVKGIQKGLAISGNFLPWQVDKIVSTLSTPSYRPITSNIAPALNIIDDLWRALQRVAEDPSRLANLPVINELTSYYERMNRAAGGEVNVPQAPKEPDQRIDKMTGLPYDVQAGDAFIDNEDPLRRLGFKGGGIVTDPLKRMGFGIGGAVVKLGKAALKSLDDDIAPVLTGPLKTTNELIAEGNKLSKAVEAGEDVVKKISKGDDTLKPYENVPKPASYSEMSMALDARKKEKINIEIPEGSKVGLRLDIPAYTRHDVWVPTIHDEGGTKLTSHRSTAAISDVDMTLSSGLQEKASRIKEGGAKSPFARIGGKLINRSDEDNYRLAKKYLNDPEWTQVGYNPDRHSYFFDRRTGSPVVGGDEAIQVGPLVLVKNALFGDKTNKEKFKYAEGGSVLKSLKRKTDNV